MYIIDVLKFYNKFVSFNLIINSFLASGIFCPLLINFANSLDPDQDLFDPETFFKKLILKKVSRRRKHEKLPSMQSFKICATS